MARENGLSIIGHLVRIVPQELFEAHIQLVVHLTLTKDLSTPVPELPIQETLPAGTQIWVDYITSKQNERSQWISATVVRAGLHIANGRRSQNGFLLTAAYEHVRLAPSCDRAKEMMRHSLHEVIFQKASELAYDYKNTQSENWTLYSDTPAEISDIFGKQKNFSNDECKALLSIGVTKSSLLASKVAGDAATDDRSITSSNNIPHNGSPGTNK